jgi:predicted glycosyltransferase
MSRAKSNPEPEEQVDGVCRTTIFMSTSLLEAIDAQCAAEDKKRSPFVAEILELALTSQTGERLCENALKHERSLVNELRQNLLLFNPRLPIDTIEELAEDSQRYPDQMLLRLALLGLKVYERSIARMNAEIDTINELP